MAYTEANFQAGNATHYHFFAFWLPDMEAYGFVISPKFLTDFMDDSDRAQELLGQNWYTEAEGVFHYQNGASAVSALDGYDLLIRLGMEESPQYAAAVAPENNGILTRAQLAEAARIEIEGTAAGEE